MIVRIPKRSVLVLLVIFVMVALGGMFGLMHMEHHGAVSTCIFMPGEEAMCPMTALEHSARWQTAFAGMLTGILLVLGTFFAGLFRGTAHAPPLIAWRMRTVRPAVFYRRMLAGSTISPRAP